MHVQTGVFPRHKHVLCNLSIYKLQVLPTSRKCPTRGDKHIEHVNTLIINIKTLKQSNVLFQRCLSSLILEMRYMDFVWDKLLTGYCHKNIRPFVICNNISTVCAKLR